MKRLSHFVCLLFLAATAVTLVGCGDDSKPTPAGGKVDPGKIQGGGGAGGGAGVPPPPPPPPPLPGKG
jgi:hypothetical protein